ncbi:NADH pyrophosphatase [alpha proteobacterium U9-1i]|nr:NADH pyrophosphatase [alpha proteobacterium U9-1i]
MLLPPNPNAFARSLLDRAGHRRRDAEWLAAALNNDQTSVVAFHKHQPFLYESSEGLRVRWLGGNAPADLGAPGAPVIFLGLDTNQAATFACEVADSAALEGLGEFVELRAATPRLDAKALPILGAAKSLFEWHARNGFCANCGGASLVVEAGWKRECPACRAEHFPRVDPVCIMLPVKGDKCCMGRQRVWPRGMHSALAGFIEPGEAIEEAVARETLEEAGLRVIHVEVHSTQPWPFPHSLMIGAICEVENEDIKVDMDELESARWFTREDVQLLLAGKHPDAFCPPPFAIAHQLIKTWAERA